MGKMPTIHKHLTQQEIKRLFKATSHYKEKIKLLALMNLYNGKTMIDTADFLMISYSNLKKFIKRWNEEGLFSLEKTNDCSQKFTEITEY